MKKLDDQKLFLTGGTTYTKTAMCYGFRKDYKHYHFGPVTGTGTSAKAAETMYKSTLKTHKSVLPNYYHSL